MDATTPTTADPQGIPGNPFQVLSATPGRLRVAVAGLRRNAALAEALEARLGAGPMATLVSQAQANRITGTVLVVLLPGVDRAQLEAALGDCLSELSQHPGDHPRPDPTGASRVTNGEREASQRRRRVDAAGARGALADAIADSIVAGARVLRALSHPSQAGLIQWQSANAEANTPRARSRGSARNGKRNRGPHAAEAFPRTTGRASRPWHTLDIQAVLSFWETRPEGLASGEVHARLTQHGENVLSRTRTRSGMEIFADQLKSAPVAMLAASAGVSLATGGVADAVMIGTVVLVNALVGYATESGAERAIASLSETESPPVDVVRQGQPQSIAVEAVVPGDVLVLTPGTQVPADARILHAQDLSVDESALTGESHPVSKTPGALDDPDLPLADRRNMVYRSTVVTGGNGQAIVVATGATTEIGVIQELLDVVRPPETGMQRQLNQLGRHAVTVSGVACGAVFLVGALRGQSLLQMFKTGISLAVAAVPEGLPTVAVTTLALGLSRMRDRNVLVRHLDAVETLGSLQVMCLDKTGTITVNQMSVREVYVGGEDGNRLRVKDDAIHDANRTQHGPITLAERADLEQLLRVALLCNEAELDLGGDEKEPRLQGSPTEAALLQLAHVAGVDVPAQRQAHPVLGTRYRAENRNIMSTWHPRSDGEGQLLAVKGRPAEVLQCCTHLRRGDETAPLSEADRTQIETINERLAGKALRVLGLAYRHLPNPESDDPPEESDLIWLGLVGMSDPPRAGMGELMDGFHRAGIRTVMITGDQSATAQAVGREIGLASDGHFQILDSTSLEQLDPGVLQALAQKVNVFSRVSPAHKLQIVQALQASGQVVAMTGDGINDGPALKAANIGVAMGAGGTAVVRDVADIVLEDDNLQTMLIAIQQGRTIYDDIRKAVHFILSTNISEIMVTLAMVAAGLGEGLSPMQLLWINLVTDIFPELALAVEPPADDVMQRGPRDPHAPMFDRRELTHIGIEGSLLSAGALWSCAYGLRRYGRGQLEVPTLTFLTLVCGQLLHTLSSRSGSHSLFDKDHLAANPYVPLALGSGIGLTALTQVVPPLRRALGSAPIARADWGAVALGAGVPFLLNEGLKFWRAHRGTHTHLTDTGESDAR